MAGIGVDVTVELSSTAPGEEPVWEALSGWRSVTVDRGRRDDQSPVQAGRASVVPKRLGLTIGISGSLSSAGQ